eukprot:Skav216838  [mRNA]  locus=scaffold989:24077:25047:+ [translate_table: standard]
MPVSILVALMMVSQFASAMGVGGAVDDEVPASISTETGFYAQHGALELLASGGATSLKIPVFLEDWRANTIARTNDGGILYRSWLQNLIRKANTLSLNVTLVTGDGRPASQECQAMQIWEEMEQDSDWQEINKVAAVVRHEDISLLEVATASNATDSCHKAFLNSSNVAKPAQSTGWPSLSSFSEFMLNAPLMAYVYKNPTWMLAALSMQSHPASAAPAGCLACWVTCCGGMSLICGCVALLFIPPAFLECAAAACGGLCLSTCNAGCIGSPL